MNKHTEYCCIFIKTKRTLYKLYRTSWAELGQAQPMLSLRFRLRLIEVVIIINIDLSLHWKPIKAIQMYQCDENILLWWNFITIIELLWWKLITDRIYHFYDKSIIVMNIYHRYNFYHCDENLSLIKFIIVMKIYYW